MRIVLELAVAGVMVGALYGLLGFTITLMFRSTAVLSLAHAAFALVGAYLYTGLVCKRQTASLSSTACSPWFPPWAAALIAVSAAVALALVVERLVIRPLRQADSTTKSLGTAAVLGLASGLVLQIFGLHARNLPQDQALVPAGGFTLFGVVVEWKRLLLFVLSIVMVGALAALLRRSWLGLGLRAAGQLPEVARLMGIRPNAVSRFNWALGGALAGFAGVLVAPLTNVNVGTFSFLFVKAVGAALIGGLVSLPLTFAGGVLLGLVEAITPHFWARPGSEAVGIAVLVFLAMLLRGSRLSFLDSDGTRFRLLRRPSAGEVAVASWYVGLRVLLRRVPRPVWWLAGAACLVYPLGSEFHAAVGLNALFYGLAALSFVLITGSCGQPSLMQMSFVGMSGYAISTALHHGMSFGVALALAVVGSFVIGVGVGLFALRFRGVEFAILTLTLGAVVSDFVLADRRLYPTVSEPTLFGIDLLKPQNAYLCTAALGVVAFFVVGSVMRSSLGRGLVSLRRGRRILAHHAVNPTRAEAGVFGLSSAIAALAGGAYALLVNQFGAFQFVPLFSITLLLAALVGGLRSLWGPVITGVIFGVGPTFLQNFVAESSANAYPQIIGSLMVLVLLIAAPDGLASLRGWAEDVLERAPQRPLYRGQFVADAPTVMPQPSSDRGSLPSPLRLFFPADTRTRLVRPASPRRLTRAANVEAGASHP